MYTKVQQLWIQMKTNFCFYLASKCQLTCIMWLPLWRMVTWQWFWTWVGRTMLMGPQMQFEAQTCQKLKANCCKMSNKLISWGEFSFANKQCADDKKSINASHANGDDDAPLETLGCCRWQRRGWWGQCRGNRRKSIVGIWEGKSSEQFQNLYQWFRQD